ncbi:MAG: CPBP family intramembrane glutamic endopeptidase [Pseudomonadota bacterium]|nr:CPBP family intramembrane glutamic endopeptidase [Pseudomonadota bacterium]
MRAIGVFLVVSFGVSWAIGAWLCSEGGLAGAGAFATLYMTGFMFGPAIGAIVATLLFDRSRALTALGFKPGRAGPIVVWTVWGWLVPVVLAALASVVTLVLTRSGPADAAAALAAVVEASGQEVPMSPELLLTLQLAIGVPVGILTNTVLLTISEELGWRGWLQPRLSGLGFWVQSLVIGVIWGVWHAPLILMGYNYPGLGWTGVAVMTLFTVLLTPYLALARERGGGVYAAGAFHGSINAVAGVGLIFLPEQNWPWNGLLGLGGFAVLAAGLVPIALYRQARTGSGQAPIDV